MSAAAAAAPFVFIVTGEPSGDALGGALIAALRQRFGAGDLNSAQALGVASNATIQRFRDSLPIFRGAQFAFVGGIADKGDFGEDRGHIRSDQHDEGRLLHATIFHAGILCRLAGVESLLHGGGELA